MTTYFSSMLQKIKDITSIPVFDKSKTGLVTENAREVHLPRCRRETGGGRKARAMVEGKLLIRARLNACLGSHFPCRSSPWPKEDEQRRVIGRGRKGSRKNGGALRGRLRLRETRKGCGERTTERRRRREGRGLMKSVCPVKVKINWHSGGGYRDNQPGPVVFKLCPLLQSLPLFTCDRIRNQRKKANKALPHVF